MTFGQKLKAERERKGITQESLAGQSGVSVRMIQLYEKDASFPRANVAQKLAHALGTTVGVLLNEKETLIAQAKEEGGVRAERDIAALITEVSALFAGGQLDEDEMDEVIGALNFAYWDAKKKNKKYAAGKKS